MRMRIVSVLVLVVLILVTSAHGTGNQTLFFDDFTESQFTPYWQVLGNTIHGCLIQGCQNGNISQFGGLLSIVEQKALLTQGFGYSSSFLEANNTDPVISTTTSSQFFYMVWKMQPFNLTQVGNSPGSGIATRNAETHFGLFAGSLGIGFQVVESDSVSSNLTLGTTPQREAVGIYINNPGGSPLTAPMGQTTQNCFYDNGHNGRFGQPSQNNGKTFFAPSEFNALQCLNNYPAIVYSNHNEPFDLNNIHLFIMKGFLDSVVGNGDSWVSFQVDNNAWMNVTQTACLCLNQPVNGFGFNLYPAIINAYCAGLAGCVTGTVGQSLGTFVDYVVVDNYVPASLPNGQLVSPVGSPPTHNQGIYQPGGFSLTQYIQFSANEIGQGNLYAGGILLMGLSLLVISVTLGAVMLKVRRIGFLGMIWDISSLVIVFFFFYCGVVPLLYPVLMTIGAAAVFFGIIRSGPPGEGGIVPD